MLEVCRGSATCVGVVLQEPDRAVAAAVQQAAHSARIVVVVDVDVANEWRAADGAAPALALH